MKIKYSVSGKSLPPQPIRMSIPGWGGADVKKENGSEPQPWHCPPLVEAATYGVELVYPYETECHVVNDNGEIRFEWAYNNEPGIKLVGTEFDTFFPKPAHFYFFETGVDLQAPPGYVLRTQPHPRFFTDDTGTVPPALMGHVQSEWWPKRLFVVFRVPPPGRRHIFRKGEPYVQILFVPQRLDYEMEQMTPEEDTRRRRLENAIQMNGSFIAKNVWHNPAGSEFKDHYRVLGRAFANEGMAGVEKVVEDAIERRRAAVPERMSIPELFELALRRQEEQKFVEAREIYFSILRRDQNNAEAASRLGILAAEMGLPVLAVSLMERATKMQPMLPSYHANLGEMLRRMGRLQESEAAFRSALAIAPRDAQILSALGVCLSQQGRYEESEQAASQAVGLAPDSAIANFRMGFVLAQQRRYDEARSWYQAALALNPQLVDAKKALEELPAKT